jgi:CRP/FNR family transcriptional regulator, cyclic AMP receptor protein
MRVLLTYPGWESVCELSEFQQFPVAAVLFRQGTVAKYVILLESGWVKLARQEQDGREQIIALCPPGSLLGAEVLIAEQLHPTTAITLSKCQLHLVPTLVFLNWIRTDPRFSWQIHRALSRRIHAMGIRSTQQKYVPSRLRLEQLLWQLVYAQRYDATGANGKWKETETKVFLPLQRQELAQMISVTPEYLSRLLGKMEKEGIVRRESGWLIVPHPERLWRTPEVQAMNEFNLIQPTIPDLPDLIIA